MPVKKIFLSHMTAGLSTFGALGLGIIILIQTLGEPGQDGPEIVVGLFGELAGMPPDLKDRLPGHKPGDPNLGVQDPYIEDYTDKDDIIITPQSPKVKIIEGPNALPRAPDPGLTQKSPTGLLPRIGKDGRKPSDVYARPFKNESGRPAISIVIGGLGLNRIVTNTAIESLPPDITLSFVPYADNLQSWIDRARAAGHEVLLEIPMEPYDYANNDTGPYTLLRNARADENLRRLNWLLTRVTGYFGVMNYQGAKFSASDQAVKPFMETIKQRGLAFVHDGSLPRTVFAKAAADLQVKYTQAHKVIDARLTVSEIDEQLLHLEAMALQNGMAIGSGFSYPITVEQIQYWSQTLTDKGYVLAPISALLEARTTSPDHTIAALHVHETHDNNDYSDHADKTVVMTDAK